MTVLDNPMIQLPKLKTWGDGGWRSQANCKGTPTDNFFPDRGQGIDNSLPVARARLLCLSCSVRLECVKFALENVITDGTYGGLPPKERRPLSAETVTLQDIKIPIKKAAHYAKRATRQNPIPILASILDTTEQWVADTIRNDPDYRI